MNEMHDLLTSSSWHGTILGMRSKEVEMAKRTAEIMEIKDKFTLVLYSGQEEVTRTNFLSKRADAEFHANRWMKEGRYLLSTEPKLKPRTCADKKCQEEFVPKKKHGKYCSKQCGDRVRHERSYKRQVG